MHPDPFMEMHRKRIAAVVMILLLLIAVAILYALTPADADPGDIEVRGYIPLAPDPKLTIGGGLAVQVAEVDPEWWFIGDWLPHRGLFLDVLYMDGKGRLAGSGSLKPMYEDNGMRAFFSVWWEGGADWTCGLSQVVSTW